MGSTIEIVLTVLGISFWFLFPIGMFISVSKLDKNTDQLVRLYNQEIEEMEGPVKNDLNPSFTPVPSDWHHPVIYFRRWLQHD